MMRFVIVAAAMFAGIGALVAQEDVVAKRQDLMKQQGRALGALGAMAREQRPYDQATVDASLQTLEDTAKQIAALYPESSKDAPKKGDYSASPKIWTDKAGFQSHIDTLIKAVADNKGKITNLDTLKPAVPMLGKGCGGCHETFRVKNS